MKTNEYSRMQIALGAIGLLIAVTVVSGVGAFFGSQMGVSETDRLIQLHAGTAARGKSVSMATGSIDGNVEGLFILNHASGELQCWVLSPRTGAVGGIYRANVPADMGNDKGGEADYVMATGGFFFTGNKGGNVAPGQSVCYVADTKSGKVVGYGLQYDQQGIRRGVMQSGLLQAVCNGTVGGAGATRDQ
jgi:hypothetical protein